jgi:hypothetical protein
MVVRSESTEQMRSSVTSCVVYDQKGAIVHVHSVVTVDGAKETPPKEVEKHALEMAADRGLETSGLHALHVHPDQLQPGVRYRVDPASRSLSVLE